MKNFFIGVGVFYLLVCLLWVAPVRAAGPSFQVRALFPQPDTGQPEWILLEAIRTIPATGSAELKDTHGSVKSFKFISQANQDWYWISATVSGIALNNDQDAVELWWNSELQDRSATYSASKRGEIWTKLSGGWVWLSADEFWNRWEDNFWETETGSPTVTPPATPSSGNTSSFSGIPSHGVISSPQQGSPFLVSVVSTASSTPAQNVATTPYPGKPVHLSATPLHVSTSPVGPPPEPDYAAEEQKYGEWLRWWQRGSILFVGSALVWIYFLIPRFISLIAQARARRWKWSLL